MIVAAGMWHLPLVRTPKLDSAEYIGWALSLATGHLVWPIVSAHGPGYPFFLAALLIVGAGSLHAALLAQAALGAVTATLVAGTATELLDVRIGFLAGLVYALYGPAVYVDAAFLAEGLLLFFLAVALFAICGQPFTKTRAAVAGAAFGAATLVRPTALALASACVLWSLVSRRPRKDQPVTRAAVLVLAVLLAISPALAKNWSASHILGIQGYGGLNFYIGNSPLHTGRATFRVGGGWDALNSEASRAGLSDPSAQDRYYISKTLGEIEHHVGDYLKLLAVKFLWLFQAEEVRDSHSYYFFTDQLWTLRVLPRMSLLLPLAGIGLFPLITQRERTAVLLYIEAAAAATVVFLVVGTRYRMPLVPVLAMAAGAGLDALYRGIVTFRPRRLAAYMAVAAAAVLVSHLLSDPKSHNLAEEWALTGSALVTEHNLAGATSAYDRALALDPDSGLAWDGLGLVYLNSGDLSKARQAFSRALAANPDNFWAVFHTALVDEQQDRLPEAIQGYRRALALSPGNLDVIRQLGEALLADNHPVDALSPLQEAVDVTPGDPKLHWELATALGLSGKTADARREMEQVVSLAPGNGEAWLDLCLLSLDLHDVKAAAVALQRAREGGASPDRLAFASAALARVRQ